MAREGEGEKRMSEVWHVDKEAIAGRMKSLRDHLGLSQEALAAACGVRRAHVADVENGRAGPSLQFIGALSMMPINRKGPPNAVRLHWLFFGDGALKESIKSKTSRKFVRLELC